MSGLPSTATTATVGAMLQDEHVDDVYKDAPILSGSNISIKKADETDELTSKQFRKWGAIIRGDMHLVSIDAYGMESDNKSGAKYRGVEASFCKLDWDQYKKDPPSLPMFKFLVSASKCDKNLVTMDLATVVQKTREYDKIRKMRHINDGLHTIPPSGFVFHESRVGSTLVANSLTAMDPTAHRVYSESHPMNDALKENSSDMDANIQLLRDVVYLMGRTSSAEENQLFFKVSSVGSKRIHFMQKAFPNVPWIFVYRDPVQTMMSHLDPAKLGNLRGMTPQAVCLRGKRNPPKDLIRLAMDHDASLDELSYEEFCAAHLATLCESALKGIKKSNGKGAAVEYDGLVEKLIQAVIPHHFGLDVDDAARERIRNVAKTYSKSKLENRDWVEDSKTKDVGSTPKIRNASKRFLDEFYEELGKFSIK